MTARGVGAVRWLARTLVALGAAGAVLVGGLVAGEAWTEHATGRVTGAAQQRLAGELDRGGAGPPEVGDPVGTLSFSRDGHAIVAEPVVVVHGVEAAQLADGPGHYPSTPLPHEAGATGNVGIAGHRTTYGAPFRHLDRLTAGDVVTFDTPAGTYRYRVAGRRVVDPADTSVLDPDPMGTGAATLTLTTCDPPGRAAARLIVFAERVG